MIRSVGGGGRVGPPGRVVSALVCFLAVCCLLGGCGVPRPDGPADTYFLDFSLPPHSRQEGTIVFFLDGVNARIFQEMLEAGELPAAKKYFVDRGLYAPRALASTPSVTLANEVSVVTGLFPGHHGVTGINWFDRNRLVWRDYNKIAQKDLLDGDYIAPTVFERVGDRTTASVFFQAHRGATRWVEDWALAGPPYFFGYYEWIDRLTCHQIHLVTDIARQRHEFPAVTFCYLLSPDFRAYLHGADSPQYRQALRYDDRLIGRVLGDVERAGLLDKIHVALVSDHGHVSVERHFPMQAFVRDQLGVDLAAERLWEDTPLERRMACYERYSAVMYGSGDRYVALCLRRPIRQAGRRTGWEPWVIRPTAEDLATYPVHGGPAGAGANVRPGTDASVDLPAALSAQEAVDAVAYRVAPDVVRIRRRTGEIELRSTGSPWPVAYSTPAGAAVGAATTAPNSPAPSSAPAARGEMISYRVISGDDPLGYKGRVPAEALAGRPASPRQWLAWTAETPYPDLPAQILACFRSRLTGDVLVFAAAGWDFNNTHRSGHGGLSPEDLHVPILLAGPGVPHRRVAVARSVDLMPTVLGLLGKSVPPNLDGMNLLAAPGEK